jgi:hypothetical protein
MSWFYEYPTVKWGCDLAHQASSNQPYVFGIGYEEYRRRPRSSGVPYVWVSIGMGSLVASTILHIDQSGG